MKVTIVDFSFTFGGQKIKATCQKMKVYKHPHLRVAVHGEKGKADIYIFHEINEPKQKYFWFQLSETKQEVAKVIAKKLESFKAGEI
ncbi:hypothetical protein BH10BAC2_BH10BAC2_40000 [soil metagenome]